MKMAHLQTQIASFHTEPINVKPPPVTPGELSFFWTGTNYFCPLSICGAKSKKLKGVESTLL